MSYRNVQLLGNYLDLLLDMLCVVDDAGCFVYVSASVEQILGYTPAELIGKPMRDYIWPDDVADTLSKAQAVIQGQSLVHFENRYRHKQGHAVYLSWSARRSATEQVRVGVARDISTVRLAQARQQLLYAIAEATHQTDDLAALYQRIATLLKPLLPLQHLHIAVGDAADTQWQILPVAQDAQHGAAPEVDTQLLCRQVALSGKRQWAQPDQNHGWLALPLPGAESLQGVLLLHPGTGLAYQDADLVLLDFLAVQLGAAIERKTMLLRLQQLALYDSLTGLANRTLLLDRLQSALQRASRDEQPLALLYLDLDRFKQVNDNFGHAVGDLLLQQTAQRILQVVRQTDTVARFGGDEFVVLLEQLHQADTALLVAEKIRQALAQPFLLAGQQFLTTPSIGLALFPQHGADGRQLLHSADSAMYQAKREGGDQIKRA
jgi:diguanylate cyclase (GGDEF)-like protein/PAS domain S-box-containing protein